MLALVCDLPPRLDTAHPEPVRRAGEALVRTRLAGICDTDLQLARGYMGFRGVLGHEGVGEVLDADDRSLVGRRVVADINAGCGRCAECASGDGHHCAARTVLGIVGRDGVLAERFTIPERCLVPVPDSVPDDLAVFAEPAAAALHVLDEAPRGGPIVVLGDGKLGLLVARALRSEGVPTIVVGHHDEKLAHARTAGADTVLERDVGSDLAGVPAVVDATGSERGLALALRLVRPRGTVVLKTTVAGATSADLSPIVIHELRVVGSRCGDLRAAIDAFARGRLDPRDLVAGRYPLREADRAVEHAARPGTLKILVEA